MKFNTLTFDCRVGTTPQCVRVTNPSYMGIFSKQGRVWSIVAGLEKIPISEVLVTLLHICGVLPTPQLLRSLETPHRVLILPHRVQQLQLSLENQTIKWVFHNVFSLYDVSKVSQYGLWLKWSSKSRTELAIHFQPGWPTTAECFSYSFTSFVVSLCFGIHVASKLLHRWLCDYQ